MDVTETISARSSSSTTGSGSAEVTRAFERLYAGCRWAEGPVYVPAGRYLVWSDIPNDRMLRWDEMTGNVGVFRHPAGFTNGNTLDRQGRLVTCEHGNRRVTRTEHDGSITVLADQYDGKRLNSPNDVVVRSDGSIWFTDPSYGIDSDYEGHRGHSEIGACNVYRLRPLDRRVAIVADDFVRPNGLAFSLDESHALHRRHRAATTSACSRSTDLARSARARCSPSARPGSSTASASMTPAASGRRPATASTASTPTAR